MMQRFNDIAKNKFVVSFVASGLLLTGAAVFTQQAQAEDGQCASVVVENGQERGASYSAGHFSEQNKGNVGVYIYVGSDFEGLQYTPGQIGRYLVKEIEVGTDLNAECFIHPQEVVGGSRIGFKVDGITVSSADRGYNLAQALDQSTIQVVRGTGNLSLASVEGVSGE